MNLSEQLLDIATAHANESLVRVWKARTALAEQRLASANERVKTLEAQLRQLGRRPAADYLTSSS